MKWNPENDGVDHINVYSKGGTALGRFLSNFAYAPIDTEDGRFNSIEGYWYWLGTNHKDKDKLRKLHGFEAKKVGRELKGLDWQDTPDFKAKIEKAIVKKIESEPNMKKYLLDNKLPLTHYYVYGGKVINVPEAEWILDILRGIK